jgi:hypothetical protein
MTVVAAAITISVDGFITGPNDGPERGLGEGGERLHYWVFGGRQRWCKAMTFVCLKKDFRAFNKDCLPMSHRSIEPPHHASH